MIRLKSTLQLAWALLLIGVAACDVGPPGAAGADDQALVAALARDGGITFRVAPAGIWNPGDADADASVDNNVDGAVGDLPDAAAAAVTTTAVAVGQQAADTLDRASMVSPSRDAPPVASGPSCALAPRRRGTADVPAGALLAFVAAALVGVRRRRRAPGGACRKRPRAWPWGALLLLGSLGAGRPALAADVHASKEHFKKGSAAYDLGRFDDAIREFEAAYQAKSDPALLFNVAQAHRRLGHADAALRFYRAYLRKAPRAHNRTEVEARIKTLQDIALNDTVLQPGEGGRPDAPGRPSDIQPMAPDDGSMAATDFDSSPTPRPGRRVAGVVTMGLGVAAIVGGVAWRLSASADAQRVTQAGKDGQRFDQELQDLERQALRNHTWGTVSIGVGSAAVVTGVLLYFLGSSPREGARDGVSLKGASLTGRGGTLRFEF